MPLKAMGCDPKKGESTDPGGSGDRPFGAGWNEFGSKDAFGQNALLEMQTQTVNATRFFFCGGVKRLFDNFSPLCRRTPGSWHQVNLEYLASCGSSQKRLAMRWKALSGYGDGHRFAHDHGQWSSAWWGGAWEELKAASLHAGAADSDAASAQVVGFKLPGKAGPLVWPLRRGLGAACHAVVVARRRGVGREVPSSSHGNGVSLDALLSLADRARRIANMASEYGGHHRVLPGGPDAVAHLFAAYEPAIRAW